MRVHQQAAYVLLNRPYSETSWIVEIISRDYGRLALMAKGARRIKSKLKGALLPFQPVLLSWTGKGEVPTLTSAEIDQSQFNLIDHELTGDALVCGFYCNELVINVLHRHDPHPVLFDEYHKTILALCNSPDLAKTLRDFEQLIIKETGYEVSFEFEADGKTPINADNYYHFVTQRGFLAASQSDSRSVQGKVILALRDGHRLNDQTELSASEISDSKHLMRDILRQTLGNKKIVSRELFYPKARRY